MAPEPGDNLPYQSVEYLREHGPAPVRELPTEVSTRHRVVGVHSFSIQGGSVTEGIDLGSQPELVYHLDEHSPRPVISTFLETNP